jgi:hypothetical protein
VDFSAFYCLLVLPRVLDERTVLECFVDKKFESFQVLCGIDLKKDSRYIGSVVAKINKESIFDRKMQMRNYVGQYVRW